ncbi:UBC-like protein [Glarea lozoyensis ATCC 20868]|uniref:UBC-like protein n=1 Tax=Glarea lozoyensis (strain ATCC 20868 / MF5171) TaxID=1116229 RepID=S3D6P4_GLAL2|nr:UBC-like protein [Glarea lozoyensis ATCC 20868]EPE33440.1 UBC-like protein [Glarea lozoyensis ATCC 20868]
MGRKAYIADVAAAAALSIPGITSVVKGSEDGDVHVCYTPATGLPIEISLLSLEVGGYPQENFYMITTESMDLPAGVNSILAEIQESSAGKSIQDLISTISKKLGKHLAMGSKDDVEMEDNDADFEDDEEDPEDSQSSSDEDPFDMDGDDEYFGQREGIRGARLAAKVNMTPEIAKQLNRRIRSDLRAARQAGFKIGIVSGAKAESMSSIISISVKVDNLGLSEEAVQAWDLEPQQYIVFLIRYADGYRNFEQIMDAPAKSLDIDFRVGVSNKYKPGIVPALAAFTDSNKDRTKSTENTANTANTAELPMDGHFSNMFISSSLNDFINTSLISLLKIRDMANLSWRGAKLWFNEKQSRHDVNNSDVPSSYYDESVLPTEKHLPELLVKDHLLEAKSKKKTISFPLLAAQFAVHYLARCTEYCLVCHDEIEQKFEALKPYVCSKPLCLYQYMSLGFGPSIEHEILTQPYVVDLLVSFCYAAAWNKKLREYPTGMSLAVPLLPNGMYATAGGAYIPPTYAPTEPTQSAATPTPPLEKVKFNPGADEIVFETLGKCPVRTGDWIVLMCNSTDRTMTHYRIQDTSRFPNVTLSTLGVVRKSSLTYEIEVQSRAALATPATPPTTGPIVDAEVAVYSHNFDDMIDLAKAEQIVMLLETLPSIREMRAYLVQQARVAEPNLRAWNDRISPAALGLLRWIVASNRSCIVQVDECPSQIELEVASEKIRLDQRISNIEHTYVQFRFSQGAPDKEQRFLSALNENRNKLNPKYPTVFAWHGSALFNWHSIIRSGLDFKEISNGRAHGNGVYHALEQLTSVSYAGAGRGAGVWHGSELKINMAMSLNEIVNAPSLFTSCNPFLVVQYIDWIQCRYLLVQTGNGPSRLDPPKNPPQSLRVSSDGHLDSIEQDPAFTAKSVNGKPIGIPLCAITTSRGFRADSSISTPRNKKRRHARSFDELGFVAASDNDELEDIQFLLSDDENEGRSDGKSSGPMLAMNSTSLTDFVPGSLNRSSLPMLDPPSYATPMATKTLQRNLKEVLDIQSKTPIHELGWFIDAELIDNFYQWIVELHSFDPETPLAKDMKAAGVTSVVLEIRFGKDYPHSPPFVRVIRPRFLPFTQGGGGHVTAGGAMCMELLTNSGWSAVSSIESVLLQVRMAMMNPEPKPARLESQQKSIQRDYGIWEAIDAYKRACAQHGWQVPPDFGDFANNGGDSRILM